MKTVTTLIDSMVMALYERKPRSAWAAGVRHYASVMLERLQEEANDREVSNDIVDFMEAFTNISSMKDIILNGVRDFKEASYGGCWYIYDEEIAIRLCNMTELRKTDFGRKAPNKNETWLDVQARALYQAWNLVRYCYYKVAATQDFELV